MYSSVHVMPMKDRAGRRTTSFLEVVPKVVLCGGVLGDTAERGEHAGTGVRGLLLWPASPAFDAAGEEPIRPARSPRPSPRDLPVPRAETEFCVYSSGRANGDTRTLQGFWATTLPSFQM
jgi:hypothetical protein